MIMKRLDLLVLATLILFGCGDGSGGRLKNLGEGIETNLPSPRSTPNAKVELKGRISRKLDSRGKLNYLGELINNGEDPACFVEIVIDSQDVSGGIIGSDFTYVYGSTLSIGSTETDSCLKSGEVGGFHISTSLESVPASASVVIRWDVDNISAPRVPSSQVILDGSVTESTNFYGHMTLKGFIKNHSMYKLNFVKITFVAVKNGEVVNTHSVSVKGSTCDLTETCLFPNGSGAFDADFEMPPSEIDSYYYKINYNILEREES
jgi:hypothetical protein